MLKSNITAISVKEIINVISTIVNVEITNCLDGQLVTNGILDVLIRCMIKVCEIIPNANQPVWNKTAFSNVLKLKIFHNIKKHKIYENM